MDNAIARMAEQESGDPRMEVAMTMLLNHRWEHAMVGAVVESAKKACPDCYLGRTAIQKLIYFLNVLNVPMQFQFRIHHFGPFCDELAGTLDWLLADAIIVDESSEARYSNYNVGENWSELKDHYGPRLAQYDKTIQAVATALGNLEPSALELIATLHFSFRWVRARGEDGPWKVSTVKKFKEIKRAKFSDTEIDSAYEWLVSCKLIEG